MKKPVKRDFQVTPIEKSDEFALVLDQQSQYLSVNAAKAISKSLLLNEKITTLCLSINNDDETKLFEVNYM